VAFHIYLLIPLLVQDYVLAKLISLILLGALLGSILVTVISAMEDFEMEYISPEKFQSVVPISKWLKSGTEVTIGTDSSNYVYVKWDDGAAQPQHAKLLYENGAVFIVPFADTLVRGQPIPLNRKTALQNGDVIQLGRDSITRMRYKEKRTAQAPPQAYRPLPVVESDGKAAIRITR
jgi:predicted component of type VI protein secretion system